MKQFNNLLDAINFHTHCPLCQTEMCTDKYTNSKQKIALEFLGNVNEIMYIDVATQDIEFVLSDDMLPFKNNKNGTLGQSFTMECDDCHMYCFSIQVWIDLSKQVISRIILNSERLSWEDENNVLHEIVTMHSVNKTKYSYICPGEPEEDGIITLPLIPIDVYNPKDAVDRIRKLIVFS